MFRNIPITESRNLQLYHAAKTGDIAQARLMLDNGADINAYNSLTDCTALHAAATNGQTAMEKFLLSRNASISKIGNQASKMTYLEFGDTGIIEIVKRFKAALTEHNFATASTLLQEHNYLIDICTEAGTILCEAIENNDTMVAQFLIEHHANVFYKTAGFNPLFIAIFYRRIHIVKLLLPLTRDTILFISKENLLALLQLSGHPNCEQLERTNFLTIFDNMPEDQVAALTPLDLAMIIGHRGIVRFCQLQAGSVSIETDSNDDHMQINIRLPFRPDIVRPELGFNFPGLPKDLAAVIADHLELYELANLAQACRRTHALFAPTIPLIAAKQLVRAIINFSNHFAEIDIIREIITIRPQLLEISVSTIDQQGRKWININAYEAALATGCFGLIRLIGSEFLMKTDAGNLMKRKAEQYYYSLFMHADEHDSIAVLSVYNLIENSPHLYIKAAQEGLGPSNPLTDALAVMRTNLTPGIVQGCLPFPHYRSLIAALKLLQTSRVEPKWNDRKRQLFIDEVITPLIQLLPSCDLVLFNNAKRTLPSASQVKTHYMSKLVNILGLVALQTDDNQPSQELRKVMQL